MRLRILLAILLTTCARPALASDPPEAFSKIPPSAQTLIAIADVQLDAAFDEKSTAKNRDELLDSARKNYQKALEIDPKGKEPLLGMARFYVRVGDRDKAVEQYKKCLTIHPKDAEVGHEIAVQHARWKDWAGAVAWCEYTLKLDPENRVAKKTMGFCLAMAGKWEEAFAALRQIMPEAQARYNLAGLLEEMGKSEDAKKQLELALKADPVYAPAVEMLREFEKQANASRFAYEAKQVTLGSFSDRNRNLSGSINVVGESAPADSANLNVFFECRLIKIPVTARDLVKFPFADGDILNAEQMKQLLTEIQSDPNGGITMCPGLCLANGQMETLRVCDSQYLTSGIEAVKVKGQTVFVPQNKLVEIGHTFVFGGKISPDKKSVEMTAKITRTWMNGPVELQPVITPFAAAKGPATGTKLFAEQYLQVADIRTEKVEKQTAIPVGGTLVMRSWTETEEKSDAGKKKSKPQTVEYICIPLVTVSVRNEASTPFAVSQAIPMAQSSCVSGFGGAVRAELAGTSRKLKAYKLKHASAQDVASIINNKFDFTLSCCSVAGPKVRAMFDVPNNVLHVQCDRDHIPIVDAMVKELDGPQPQVIANAMVVKVPHTFIKQSGLNIGGKPDAKAWVLSAREAHMLTELVRTAKERGECKVLSSPVVCMVDGQPGCVQIGGHYPVATTDASGVQQVQHVPLGLKLDLTPKISADGKSVALATSLQFTEIQGAVKLAVVKDASGTQPPTTEFTETPVFNTFAARETANLRFGETLVLATSPCRRNVSGEALKKACEKDEPYVTLVIVTPVRK